MDSFVRNEQSAPQPHIQEGAAFTWLVDLGRLRHKARPGARRRDRLSQEEAARLVGKKTHGTIQRWEKGLKPISRENLRNLLVAYNLQPDEHQSLIDLWEASQFIGIYPDKFVQMKLVDWAHSVGLKEIPRMDDWAKLPRESLASWCEFLAEVYRAGQVRWGLEAALPLWGIHRYSLEDRQDDEGVIFRLGLIAADCLRSLHEYRLFFHLIDEIEEQRIICMDKGMLPEIGAIIRFKIRHNKMIVNHYLGKLSGDGIKRQIADLARLVKTSFPADLECRAKALNLLYRDQLWMLTDIVWRGRAKGDRVTREDIETARDYLEKTIKFVSSEYALLRSWDILTRGYNICGDLEMADRTLALLGERNLEPYPQLQIKLITLDSLQLGMGGSLEQADRRLGDAVILCHKKRLPIQTSRTEDRRRSLPFMLAYASQL